LDDWTQNSVHSPVVLYSRYQEHTKVQIGLESKIGIFFQGSSSSGGSHQGKPVRIFFFQYSTTKVEMWILVFKIGNNHDGEI